MAETLAEVCTLLSALSIVDNVLMMMMMMMMMEMMIDTDGHRETVASISFHGQPTSNGQDSAPEKSATVSKSNEGETKERTRVSF